MARYVTTAVLLVLAFAAVGVGCGGGDDDQAATDPSITDAARDAERAAREQVSRRIREGDKKRKAQSKRAKAPKKPLTAAERAARRRQIRQRQAAQARRDRAEDRKFDREFDKGFEESAFDKLMAKLPIRRPPLHVQQYITTGGSHKVYTAVDRRRFLCRMTPAQRRRAVTEFFRDADKVMRAGEVNDFVQIVTVTSQTAEDLPALAVARRGSVKLTGKGRERNPC